ncbi:MULTISPECIES: LPXTG cell wall anchor domain-containing protein, partial [unclassified Staphylococcus]
DSDSDSDSDSDKKELPATGDNQQNSGLLFGSLVAGLGSLLLGRRRRKNNNEK